MKPVVQGTVELEGNGRLDWRVHDPSVQLPPDWEVATVTRQFEIVTVVTETIELALPARSLKRLDEADGDVIEVIAEIAAAVDREDPDRWDKALAENVVDERDPRSLDPYYMVETDEYDWSTY